MTHRWHNVRGTVPVEVEIKVEFESSGYSCPARLAADPEDSSPPEHSEERTIRRITIGEQTYGPDSDTFDMLAYTLNLQAAVDEAELDIPSERELRGEARLRKWEERREES